MRALIAVAAVALAGCPSPGPSWQTPQTNLPWVPLSIWSDGHDTWFAGGGLGSGEGGHLLHYDGSGFHDAAIQTPATLWWVFGLSPTNLWSCGEQGTLLHGDGTSFSPVATNTKLTLYGVWGSAPNDLYTVGGDPNANTGIILHGDGTTFTPVDTGLPATGTFFKVWGSSATDVFVVGQAGAILHFDGAKWTQQPSGLRPIDTLLTVAGRAPNDVYAVGGFGHPIALHYDGSAWSPLAGVDLSSASGLAGVSVDAAGDAVIVGFGGGKLREQAGAWHDDTAAAPHDDLHAAFAVSSGELWVVGGNYVAPPGTPRQGTIGRYAP